MTDAATQEAEGTYKLSQEEVDRRRLRDAARAMARNLLASYSVLGVSSSFMMTVAGEMVFSCLMDIARRDKDEAEHAINGLAQELVGVMDQLQGWKENEAGANGTQAG